MDSLFAHPQAGKHSQDVDLSRLRLFRVTMRAMFDETGRRSVGAGLDVMTSGIVASAGPMEAARAYERAVWKSGFRGSSLELVSVKRIELDSESIEKDDFENAFVLSFVHPSPSDF